MEPFLQEYLKRLEALHNDVKAVLAGLPQAGLDWSPGVEMNSLGVLAVHIAGAETYWSSDVITGRPSGRDREAEFRSMGLDEAALGERLERSLAQVQQNLEQLQLVDAAAQRRVPSDGRIVTLGWALSHLLSHTALHLGQMQLTRQLWEQRSGL